MPRKAKVKIKYDLKSKEIIAQDIYDDSHTLRDNLKRVHESLRLKLIKEKNPNEYKDLIESTIQNLKIQADVLDKKILVLSDITKTIGNGET